MSLALNGRGPSAPAPPAAPQERHVPGSLPRRGPLRARDGDSAGGRGPGVPEAAPPRPAPRHPRGVRGGGVPRAPPQVHREGAPPGPPGGPPRPGS